MPYKMLIMSPGDMEKKLFGVTKRREATDFATVLYGGTTDAEL